MKRIIIALVLCLVSTTAIFAQSQDTENLQILSTSLYKAGDLIEYGAQLKNTGLAIGVVGGVIGAGIISLGYTEKKDNNKGDLIAGASIAGVAVLTSLILTIVGNNNINKGGKILKNIEFNANGINVKF